LSNGPVLVYYTSMETHKEKKGEIRVSHDIRVRYAETDSMRVVHHTNYFTWMEAARTELMRNAGLTYRELEKRGFYLPVREACCKYRKPIGYDDVVTVEARLEELGGASIRIGYTIFEKTTEKKIVAEGYTLHAFTGESGGVVRVPDFFRSLFAPRE